MFPVIRMRDMLKFPFTLNEIFKSKNDDMLDLFKQNTIGYVLGYAEQPNYSGVWEIFETDRGPRNCNKEPGITMMGDILVFDSREHAKDYYSPYGEFGTVTDAGGFEQGLMKIIQFQAVMQRYKSFSCHRVIMTIRDNAFAIDFKKENT